LHVRLGAHGDTCVDNGSGRPVQVDAPYVLVTSVFDGGNYRVQPGQRVMFQHGSVHEVVDQEKESCGCPPESVKGNEFPLAQSEGLEPIPKLPPSLATDRGTTEVGDMKLVFHGADAAVSLHPTNDAVAAPTKTPGLQKKSFFANLGRFFRRLFGAE
jgi:hypothetical protein